ncbi:hypothetical protein GIB67_012006 [Kingdonia uniflora]|uniref:Uncharacterized protein n=1 Tax=Kingdonia uniflora TaxID=39325 RepID=A0A7J7M025_9MAGN|nr:hypothetical protein GIB67_012006 [Kingdonia uniflora]
MPTWPNSKLRSRCFSPTPHYPYPQPTSVSLSLSLSKTKSKHLKLLAPNLNSTMATSITTSQIQSSILTFSSSLNPNGNHVFLLRRTNPSSLSLRSSKIHQSNQLLGFRNPIEYLRFERELCSISCNSSKEDGIQPKGNGPDWPILKRWVVLWKWQTVILTMIACGLSFVLTGLVETASLPYLGVQIGELTLNEKAEILFVDQAIASAATLGVLYSLTNSFQPLPDDAFHFELREPFNLQNGWLLWAGIGLIAALSAIALLGVSMSLLGGENPQREVR